MARTQSASAHEKVLEAAIRLIGERGIEGASMEAIAQASGVSKATVYNHWKDKDALCVDVVGRLRVAPPEFHSGDPRRDLLDLLTHLAGAGRPGRFVKILPKIIGYAAANPKFARALQLNSTGPAEAQVARILGEAAAHGEISPDLDPATATSLLFGPILHSKMLRGKVPSGLPERIVDAFWRAYGGTNHSGQRSKSTRPA
jgi:AcrR family transcriptional regulator